MRKRIFTVLLAAVMVLVCFAGCGASASTPFVGTWSSDVGLSLRFEDVGESGLAKFAISDGTTTQDGVYSYDGATLTLIYSDGFEEALAYSLSGDTMIINEFFVFTRGGASGGLTGAQILTYSVVGFLMVFAVLFILFIVITLQGKIFDAKGKKNVSADEVGETESPSQTASLPDEVRLTNVDEESAAMIMAIVADETGVPIEELYFKSIKLVEGEEDK